jgi:hypothetical protein
VKIRTAPTGTDRLIADSPASLRTLPGRGQVEVFGIDHHRLQRHHLKAPVIETGRQQLGVVGVLLAMQVDGERQAQFQLRTGGKIVDRAQIDLRGDQRFGKLVDLEQFLRMRSSRNGMPLLIDSSSTSTSAAPWDRPCRATPESAALRKHWRFWC